MTPDIVSYVVDGVLQAYEGDPLPASRIALVDTLAVMAAAPRAYPKALQIARSIASRKGERRVFGTRLRLDPLDAAAAGAFLAHSIEFDDWLAPGYVHAGSIVVPLAVSLGGDRSLGEVLRLVQAGYEAGLLTGSYLGASHYHYWHSTASIGVVVAATVYSLAVEGPSRQALEASLTLASAYMGGLWSVNRARALYKPVSPAYAVQTGVLAARAALMEKVPVPGGLEEACRVMQGECQTKRFEKLGVELNGYKFYPTCRHTHTAIEAAEWLHRLVDPDSITRVVIHTYAHAVRVAGNRDPQTIEEARFSLPLLVAGALIYGRIDIGILPRLLGDPKARRLAGMVELVEDPRLSEMYPDAQPSIVEVVLRSGRSVSERVDLPRGDPGRGVDITDILEKAQGLSAYMGEDYDRILYLAEAGYGEKLAGILSI
ncbi:MAG: MmgE/PrpD family protein [Desulfurococcales archaeon]|nr:MmgE/PrpD family protein [Desulfurococcales archaeon]